MNGWSMGMASRRIIGRPLALGLLLALGAPGRALPEPRSLAELAARSDLIFVGRCEAVSCHWNQDRSLILTANRFRVSRVLKGKAGATVTLEEPGGVIGSRGLQVPGAPRFRVGEEVLLCTRRTLRGRWETSGGVQGKFRIARDAQGRPWVESDLHQRPRAPLAVFVGRLLAAPKSREAR